MASRAANLFSSLGITGSRSKGEAWRRNAVLAIAFLVMIPLFPLIKHLVDFSIEDSRYIQVIGGPLIGLFLLYSDRPGFFRGARYSPRVGLPAFAAAVILCLVLAVRRPSVEFTRLFATACALVALWLAVVLACCGAAVLKRAIFPIGCFLLAIPLPPAIVQRITTFYQVGSESATYFLFQLTGVSVLRNGSMFSIPGLDFDIAPECSGIRSGVAFLLVALLASRLFLRFRWARVILILSTVP